MTMASASSSGIGLVMADGEVQINGADVPGNSAMFPGNLVATVNSNSSLQFSDGTRAVMNPGAKMTVYREHSVLLQGVAMQQGLDRHAVVADNLKISSTSPNTAVLVAIQDATHFEAASQEGEAEVWAPTGELVARLEPGKALSFALQPEAQSTTAQTVVSQINACGALQGDFTLKNASSADIYQLQGSNLNAYVGKSIQVKGKVISAPSASRKVVLVESIEKVRHPCQAAEPGHGAVAPAATTTAAAAAAATIGTKTGIILVSVLAGSGAVAGVAAADVSSGSSRPAVTPSTP